MGRATGFDGQRECADHDHARVGRTAGFSDAFSERAAGVKAKAESAELWARFFTFFPLALLLDFAIVRTLVA